MGHGGRRYRRIGQHCLDNITRFITKRISRSSGHWHYSKLCKYGHSGRAKCRGNKARVTSILLFDPRGSKITLKSGVASIYKQHFFAQLRNATGIDLENIVYYKDDTHYFVMTARTKSLLSRGVLKSTCSEDPRQLLDRSNIDPVALQARVLKQPSLESIFKSWDIFNLTTGLCPRCC